MTAEIVALDAALERVGQDVVLLRAASGSGEIPLRAMVRGFRPSELVGGIKQGDRSVVLSPTGLGGIPAKAGDGLKIAGKRCNVETVELFHMGMALVRLELVVRG